MALPDRTLCWVEGPPWDRTCTPVEEHVDVASENQRVVDVRVRVVHSDPLLGDCVAVAVDGGTEINVTSSDVLHIGVPLVIS